MDDLQQRIVSWTKLDKELKELNKQSSELRKKKDIYEVQKKCPLKTNPWVTAFENPFENVPRPRSEEAS